MENEDEFEESGYKAIDSYDGDITDKVVVSKEEINENEYNLTYTVEDSSGNICEKIRHITLVDDVPPVITLNGNINVYMNINNEYVEPGYTVIDGKDGDISDSVQIEGVVDTSKSGINILTYKVKDHAGNEAVVNRYVIVAEQRKSLCSGWNKWKKRCNLFNF